MANERCLAQLLSTLVFEIGFLSSLELADSVRVAGQKVSSILLSPHPSWGYRYTHLVSVGTREQTQVLKLMHVANTLLSDSHLLSY